MEFNAQKIKDVLIRFALKAWDYIKMAKIELIVLFGSLILDLLTKFIIAKTMSVGETIVVIPSFLNFYYTINKKAAFGSAFGLENIMGTAGLRVFFLITTIISIGVFSYFLYFFRQKHIFSRLSLALIIAGALGNFYDRLFLHGVRDFVQIVFFGLDLPLLGESFAIFNIADAALVVGVIMFSIFFIFMFKMPNKEFVGPIFRPDYNENEAKADSENDGFDDDGFDDDGFDDDIQITNYDKTDDN